MKKYILAIGLVLLALPAWGAIYYVDCNADGDAGAGTGTGAAVAWKTIAKVNASSFSAGDSVLFNKGCTWREQLTVPSSGSAGNPITFGAYGSGADPIIKGSSAMGSFTAVTQWATAFSTTMATDVDNAFSSGSREVIAASSGASGSKVRLTFSANSTKSSTWNNVTIGESTANDDFDSAPTTVTFGGNASGTATAGSTLLSDEITFTFDKTKRYLVAIYQASRQSKSKNTGGDHYYKLMGANETASQTVTGFTQETQWHGLSKVEVYDAGIPSNVWQTALTTEPFWVSFNGVKGSKAASLADITATANWWWASNILYVYSVGSPDASGIEANIRNYGIYVNSKNYITLNNIKVDGTIYGGIAVAGTSAGIIGNYLSGVLNGISVVTVGSAVATFNYCTFGDGFQIIFQSVDAAGSPVLTCNNCEAYNSGDDTFSTSTTGNMVLNRCYAHNSGTGGGSQAGSGDCFTFHGSGYGKVYNSLGVNGKKSCLTASNTTSGEFYNNTCYNNWWSGASSEWDFGSMGVGFDTTGAVEWKVKNNIFSGHIDGILVTAQAVSGGLTLTSDYNIFDVWRNDGSAYNYSYNGTRYNFANFKTASSTDAHSIETGAIGVPNANLITVDYKLGPGSPAIDAGVAIVGLHDLVNRTITGGDYSGQTHIYNKGVDMGALEADPQSVLKSGMQLGLGLSLN
jgi:hypothetical protein